MSKLSNKEAIEILEGIKQGHTRNGIVFEAFNLAISALKMKDRLTEDNLIEVMHRNYPIKARYTVIISTTEFKEWCKAILKELEQEEPNE